MTSTATKFIAHPTEVVDEAINGYCTINSARVVRLTGTGVVALRKVHPNRVALICGGGSGHEPAHIGFVRDGCLTAAVCGNVFASPPITDVAAAIRYIDQEQRKQSQGSELPPRGILVVVKNYTGDVLNFGFAVREAAARGVSIEMIVVGDDVAFGSDHDGRRGVAGTVLLYQLLGCAAAEGLDVSELVKLNTSISKHLVTFGASLSSCTIPGSQRNKDVAHGTVELGLGIHGERGLEVMPFVDLSSVVTRALEKLLEKEAAVCPKTGKEDHSAFLLLNNLGSTTDLEMSVTLTHTFKLLEARGVHVVRAAVGRYMTALDMHGISWTLLRLPNHSDPILSNHLLSLADYEPSFKLGGDWIPLLAPATNAADYRVDIGERTSEELLAALLAKQSSALEGVASPAAAVHWLHVLRNLETQGDYFNQLDAKVGDGDTGFGVMRACRGAATIASRLPWNTDLPGSLRLVAHVVADAFAGSSGPLYGTFLVAVAEGLPDTTEGIDDATLCQLLRGSFIRGSEAVKSLGRAEKGERTMVDVLEGVMAAEAVHNATTVPALFTAAASAAREAADHVKTLRATKGRSRYLGGKEIGEADPGCELVFQWLSLAAASLSAAKSSA
ncbi:dihydroxyacetone kinase 1-like protein, putative [Bodo saltans]|uniref:Dihydroxyacetone kinase 1-like protein, putative n=1 Tax=Bodo saltans TaxID=75058 RepID=A0A0S4IPA3_BODSA|nr:dihydroxyacetone kinase 1-like protein, putative [Bodo saltans]|eukprot:CUE66645.1 dihydroxyacetone kinase 1-like protein, putative [Bodo saltans]